MKRYVTASVVAIAAALATASGAQAQQFGVPVEVREAVQDSYIFVFDGSVGASEVGSRADALVRSAGGQLGHVYSNTIKGFSAKMPLAAAERIAATRNVAYFEPDGVAFAIGVRASARPAPSQPAQETPWGITRVNGGVDGTGKVAWVIDTGVDQDHPDLLVDVVRSANFVSRGPDKVDDGNGHGTHVAGTIAALNNDIGVIGVAAGAAVVGVRVLGDNGSGSYADVIAGIDYVGANAAAGDVANMSLGGGFSQAVNDAVIAASNNGIFFSLAAGNDGADASNSSPASANGAFIWTVSAIDSTDTMPSWSNFGNPPVDCADPGVSVLSTWKDGGYNTISGTSMAAPHAAGVLLLTNGSPRTDGTAKNDPDGNPDPICVF